MNEQQRKMAEENHNLIYSFLHNRKLPIEEYYDICSIAYCKAVKTFNPDKGLKLSTYAYFCMDNEVKQHERLKLSVKNGAGKITVSYNEVSSIDGEQELLGLLHSSENMEDNVIAKEMLDSYLKKCSERDRKIVLLSMNGYKQQEVADRVGISRTLVSRILKKLIKYIKED